MAAISAGDKGRSAAFSVEFVEHCRVHKFFGKRVAVLIFWFRQDLVRLKVLGWINFLEKFEAGASTRGSTELGVCFCLLIKIFCR